ncbi:MAG: hypothetical protein KatS3mg085_631 [Candidatus Dojkabacteria bacterium]|nr:MAG: hypothetical protein KatS3mg085_631 [Candidatus Dojkabacteria bacterium]
MELDFYIGFVGAMAVLVPFALMKLNVWKSSDIYFNVCNLLGSTLLLVSAYLIDSIPFVLLNLVWLFFSARDVAKYFFKKIYQRNEK